MGGSGCPNESESIREEKGKEKRMEKCGNGIGKWVQTLRWSSVDIERSRTKVFQPTVAPAAQWNLPLSWSNLQSRVLFNLLAKKVSFLLLASTQSIELYQHLYCFEGK